MSKEETIEQFLERRIGELRSDIMVTEKKLEERGGKAQNLVTRIHYSYENLDLALIMLSQLRRGPSHP